MAAETIWVCHRCPGGFRAKPDGQGGCACHAEPVPVDIIDRARSGVCPKGYFTNPPRPQATQVIPEGYDPEQERRRLKQGGCCGKPSKGN